MNSILQKNFTRFQQELNYAEQNIGFYSELLKSLKINSKDIKLIEDIKKLPFTEKKHYRVNFPHGVMAKGISFNDNSLYRTQSSGTTGERLTTLEHGMLLLDRAVKCASVNPALLMVYLTKDKKTCRYAAPNCSDVECANPNSQLADRLLHDKTLVLPVYHDLLTTNSTLINRAIEEIQTYQPHLYYVDPTHFAFLIGHCNEKNIKLPEAPVITTYTGMTQIARRQIETAFENPQVIELAAMSELGWIAMECSHGNIHINDNGFLFEFVAGDRYAQTGELAELVLTSLDNGVIPHIRYKTGDAYRLLDKPCECGHPSPIAIMEGRLSNFIRIAGKNIVSPKAVDNSIGAPDWLNLYQLQQNKQGQLTFRFITNDNYQTGDERETLSRLTSLLEQSAPQHQFKLAAEQVNYISTERSGKFQFCKSDMPLLD